MSLYTFNLNSPLVYVDPDGLDGKPADDDECDAACCGASEDDPYCGNFVKYRQWKKQNPEAANEYEENNKKVIKYAALVLGSIIAAPTALVALKGFAGAAKAVSIELAKDAAILGGAWLGYQGLTSGSEPGYPEQSGPPEGVKDFDAAARRIEPVATPYGPASQAATAEAMAARQAVTEGATLWRIGTTGRSAAAEAQFWSLEHPLSPGFVARYGIPPQNVANANFIEAATLRPGTSFVTRVAPPVGTNPGGGIEVVVPEGGVIVRAFTSL
jgi:hypothetical protein